MLPTKRYAIAAPGNWVSHEKEARFPGPLSKALLQSANGVS